MLAFDIETTGLDPAHSVVTIDKQQNLTPTLNTKFMHC
jgi:uncharacterized protein YprB with RNaseH-like and TPR domain